MNLSVIICVYNGGEQFKKNIESVSRLKFPENAGVEFLFVDNNSSDGSMEVIKDYVRKYPDTFRYLLETRQGSSYALNTGVRNALGEIIAFTNADGILPENWLLKITEGFRNFDCVALGGRVLPAWGSTPPRWLRDELKTHEIFGPVHYYVLKKRVITP